MSDATACTTGHSKHDVSAADLLTQTHRRSPQPVLTGATYPMLPYVQVAARAGRTARGVLHLRARGRRAGLVGARVGLGGCGGWRLDRLGGGAAARGSRVGRRQLAGRSHGGGEQQRQRRQHAAGVAPERQQEQGQQHARGRGGGGRVGAHAAAEPRVHVVRAGGLYDAVHAVYGDVVRGRGKPGPAGPGHAVRSSRGLARYPWWTTTAPATAGHCWCCGQGREFVQVNMACGLYWRCRMGPGTHLFNLQPAVHQGSPASTGVGTPMAFRPPLLTIASAQPQYRKGPSLTYRHGHIGHLSVDYKR